MNVIDASKMSMSEMRDYFAELDGESRWLAESHLRAEELYEVRKSLDAGHPHPGLPLIQEIGVRVEIWESFGLSMEDYMAQIFGSDWEKQLKNPRSSRMSGAGTDKKLVAANKLIKAENGQLPENFAELDYDNQRKILDGRQVHHVVSRMVDVGSPVLSIKPIRAEKDPCYDENTGEKLHTPGHDRVECVSLKSFIHLAPICRVVPVVRGGGVVLRIPSANKDGFVDMKSEDGDITGGSSSLKVIIVGFAEVVKSRACGEVGKIVVAGEVRDLIEESRLVADEMLSCEIAGHSDEIAGLIYKTWLENCSLGAWYKERGMEGWKSVLKAYSGGTLKLARSPSLDNRKMAERSLKFQQGAVDRKIMEISGLSDRLTSADWLAGNYPEIPAHVRLEHEAEARKMLAISYTARLMRDHKKLQNPTHGKLRSKQTKMRVGDKSCTVNGARTGQLPNGFCQMRLSVGGEVFWKGVVNRFELLEQIARLETDSNGLLGFNWESYARDMMEVGAFKPGISKSLLSTKDNREQLAEVLIGRMAQYSLEDSLCGKSPWILLEPEGLYNESCAIEIRAAESESEVIAEIVQAAQLVEDAGEPLNERNVLSALKRPHVWSRLVQENRGSSMKAAFAAA